MDATTITTATHVINLTAHAVVVYAACDVHKDSTRHWVLNDGAKPVATIPSSGIYSVKRTDVLVAEVGGIPVSKASFEAGPLPEGVAEDDLVVVSAMASAALRAAGYKGLLAGVSQPVLDKEGGRIVGCLGLMLA